MGRTILLSIILFFGTTEVNGQTWDWTTETGSSKIIKDQEDNLYVVSNFPTGFSIEKLDQNGVTLWTRNGSGNAAITAYQIDNENNLVAVGNFTSPVSLGSSILTPKGTESFFILKVSPDSTVMSSNVYGSTSRTFANDLFINPFGCYLIGGGFTGTFDVNGDLVSGSSTLNAFMIKTDATEHLLFAEKSTIYTPSGEAFINEVEETPSGFIYATITMVNGLASINGFNFWPDYGKYICLFDDSRSLYWFDYLENPGVSDHTFSDLQTSGGLAFMKEHSWTGGVEDHKLYRWTCSSSKISVDFPGSTTFGYDVTDGNIYYGLYSDTPPRNQIGSLTTNLDFTDEPIDTTGFAYERIEEIQFIDSQTLYVGINSSIPKAGKFSRTASAITAVESADEEGIISAFPNPTQGNFTLHFQPTFTGDRPSEICIVDVFGNCLKRQKITAVSDQQFDISGMAKGVYFLEVVSGDKKSNKKIILN